MRRSQKKLMSMLYNNVDAYHADEAAAGAPLVVEIPTDPVSLANEAGNPIFQSQFDIDFKLRYFTEAGGVYTPIAPAALAASLQTQLPLFLFGAADFGSGFAFARSRFPVAVWAYGRPFIFGRDEPDAAYDAAVTSLFALGDLIIPFTANVAATDYVGFVIISCQSVGYGTLFDSTQSDTFKINTIRYVIPDTTKLTQYSKQIQALTLSLFGANRANQTSPNSFKRPDQFQQGIVDIPIQVPVDKHKALASYIQYDLLDFSWSIFVVSVRKLSA